MKTFLAFALAAAPLLACAAPAPADPDWPKSCDENQLMMTTCAVQRWQKADRELNALYGQLMKQDKDDAPKLQAAQRAWLQYRDLECTYEGAGDEGGSLQPQDIADCKNRLTRQRVADFKELLRAQPQ
jgi:uncharacterized protein YecT (DUF1311 family)